MQRYTPLSEREVADATTRHYNNKNNLAKLHWWHASVPKLTLQQQQELLQLQQQQQNVAPLVTITQGASTSNLENDRKHHSNTNLSINFSSNQSHVIMTPSKHSGHHHGYQQTSVRNKLYQHTATSDEAFHFDQKTNKMSVLDNQFNIEEDQENVCQDSVLLTNASCSNRGFIQDTLLLPRLSCHT
uniref:Uncharacterized protein n=1 Tax=Glossina palpalis gambiensis TaxID=67801 RepID=A0A1B0BSI4_9MUSC